jgi:lysophospholipase L1-like esterase
MPHHSIRLIAGLLSLFVVAAAVGDAWAAERWEQEFAAFEAQDRGSPPPQQGLVFVGSSSIRLWDLAGSFPNQPVVNRGFGGSRMNDAVRALPRLVYPLRPRALVVYSGDNDLASGASPEIVAQDFAQLSERMRKALPETVIFCLGVKPSPARREYLTAQRATNRLLAAHCAKEPKRLRFLDVEPLMLNAAGEPDPALFVDDQLHMNAQGYARWTELVQSALRDAGAMEP